MTAYLVPVQINSVLSIFNFSRLADMQWLMSMIHCSNLTMVNAVLSRPQCTYNCVSSANMWIVTWYSFATSVRSAVNSRDPRTDLWGTEYSIIILDDTDPPYSSWSTMQTDKNKKRTDQNSPSLSIVRPIFSRSLFTIFCHSLELQTHKHTHTYAHRD